ncbi:SHIRT domain-containing protein [Parvimonas micra]|uniref:SHIRT domain-containing protein n=1 Tax=Parvimonas micra TaxID=33033 RepID=UPI0022B69796|nr:SHIRT domain-containing protein [Parvimonas micra]WBB38467.1 SHIRT domain-containing protein [Parvimonas micra]
MKKFISRVLICAMLISVLPKTNFADEEKVKSEAVKKEETAKNEKTEKNAEKKETKVDKKEEAKTEKKVEKKEEVKAEEKVDKKEEAKTEKKLEKPIATSPIKPRATEDRYSVTFSFVSGTEGKDLPAEVLGLKPADQTDVPAGTNIPLENLGEVIVPEGTWHFVKWTAKIGEATIDLQDSIQVDNQDLEIVGHWRFEENPPLEKHTVFYVFESGTEGKDLPQEVMDKKPADNPNALNGSPVQIFNIEDVEVPDGTWKLEGWYREVEGERKLIDSEVMVEDEDITVYGVWKFTEKAKKYNVEFSFYSVTKGKELPDEIKAKLPANKTNVLKGTVIALPTYEDVKVEGGKWIFEGWLLETEFGYIDVKKEVVVNNGNLFLAGPWRFEADKKPQPPKPLKPQKPKVQKGRMLPKTNVESAFSYVILALAGIGGAYIAKKKDEE